MASKRRVAMKRKKVANRGRWWRCVIVRLRVACRGCVSR